MALGGAAGRFSFRSFPIHGADMKRWAIFARRQRQPDAFPAGNADMLALPSARPTHGRWTFAYGSAVRCDQGIGLRL